MSSIYPNSGGGAARPCMNCGAPVAFNQVQCTRCGTYNQLPQNQQFGQFQPGVGFGVQTPQMPQMPQTPQIIQPPQTGGLGWQNPAGSASNWAVPGQMGTGTGWQQNALFNGQNPSVPPSQPLQQNIFAPPMGTGGLGQPATGTNNLFSPFGQAGNQSSINNLFNAPPQNAPVPGIAQRGWAQQSISNRSLRKKDFDDEDFPQHRRPSKWVFATIIVLVLILIGGGIFVTTSILGGHSSTAQITPVVVATPTGTPLFSDSFKNNDAGWDLTQPTGAKVTLSGGALLLESDNHQIFPETVPGKIFDDFRLDVDAGITQGADTNGYGIYVRAGSTQDSPLGIYYRFEIYGNGIFAVYKGTQDTNGNTLSTQLKSGNSTAILNQHMNHLTVLAKGTQIIFQVNNTAIYTLNDTSYKSGSIALFVSNVATATQGVQATFKNLSIFPNK